MAKPEVTKPKTMKPKRHWLSKTLTAAMLLCFAVGGWFATQAALRTSGEATAAYRSPDAPSAGRPVTEPRYVTKNIEDIAEGDVVLARDENGDEIGWRRVVEVYHSRSDHLRHLRFRDEQGQVQSISTTDEHPFWDMNQKKFVNAGDLTELSKVTGPNGEPQTLITTTRVDHPEGVSVYNFQVEGTHTYYVAQSTNSQPILVHNTSGGLPGIPCGYNLPVGRSVIESESVTKVIDKMGRGRQEQVRSIIDRLAFGRAGGNQHALRGDLAGKMAVDVPNSGAGRGGLRLVYEQQGNGPFILHSITNYH